MQALIGLKEAAETLGCDITTAHRLRRRLNLGRRVGWTWVLTQAEVDFMKENRLKVGRPKL